MAWAGIGTTWLPRHSRSERKSGDGFPRRSVTARVNHEKCSGMDYFAMQT